jgi:hypothetical protein
MSSSASFDTVARETQSIPPQVLRSSFSAAAGSPVTRTLRMSLRGSFVGRATRDWSSHRSL